MMDTIIESGAQVRNAPSTGTLLQTPDGRSRFAMDWNQRGELRWCLLSFCCPCCAIGVARSKIDDSDCLLNCTFLHPVILRWLTRSAYNIPGSAWEDAFLGCFCPCCAINQALQTTKARGHPYRNVGPIHNQQWYYKTSNRNCCADCLYAACCNSCAWAFMIESAMNMPCWLACCCGNYCINRNLLRYHYRLQGADQGDDCVFPCLMGALCVIPGANLFVSWPYFTYDTMSFLRENEHRRFTGPYLTPYTMDANPMAINAPIYAHAMVVAPMPVAPVAPAIQPSSPIPNASIPYPVNQQPAQPSPSSASLPYPTAQDNRPSLTQFPVHRSPQFPTQSQPSSFVPVQPTIDRNPPQQPYLGNISDEDILVDLKPGNGGSRSALETTMTKVTELKRL